MKKLLSSDELTDTLLEALGCVCIPEIFLISYLDDLIIKIEAQKLDLKGIKSYCSEIIEKVFSSQRASTTAIYGVQFLRSLQKYKSDFVCLLSEKSVKSAHDSLLNTRKTLGLVLQTLKKKKITLEDCSSWLSKFKALKYTQELEIPGQYTGETKPLPQYHITIVGFHDTVSTAIFLPAVSKLEDMYLKTQKILLA